MSLPLFGQKGYGNTTANAGTLINLLLEPMANAATVLTKMYYYIQGANHTVTCLRPLGSTILASAAAASQAVVNLTADPGVYLPANSWRTANNPIAIGDYVAFQYADGTYGFDTVAAVNSLAITLTNNLPTLGLLSGAPFWFFGVKTDTNPNDGRPHPQIVVTQTASGITVREFVNTETGIISSINKNEPILLQSDNLSVAGYLAEATVAYTNRFGPQGVNGNNTCSATASLPGTN